MRFELSRIYQNNFKEMECICLNLITTLTLDSES